MAKEGTGKLGAAVTFVSVATFAAAMIVELVSGAHTAYVSYLSSVFIAMGYVLMAAAVVARGGRRASSVGLAGLTFAAIYAVLIFIVYFAMLTTVRLSENLSDGVLSIISYERLGSLFFNYNLLGYSFMALSTFFIGSAVEPVNRRNGRFRALLKIHGAFFPPCLIMPMTGTFTPDTSPVVGTVILLAWCAYFLPVCVLGWQYFRADG